jgi:hypothetical protein
MGRIIFEGEAPFELTVQTHPTAHAEAGEVVLTIFVFAADFPSSTAELRVKLETEQAAKLAGYLGPAMRNAHERKGS